MGRQGFPFWWTWEIALNHHVLARMRDREFSETDVRCMLDSAASVRGDAAPGRFIVAARHEGWTWEVVLEPDFGSRVIVVVTAYRLHR